MTDSCESLEFDERMRNLAAQLDGLLVDGSLQRLTGGASQETWAFDILMKGGILTPLILRRAPTGVAFGDVGIGAEREAWLINRAGRCGVPTARVIRLLEPTDGLGSGFVAERVSGETLPARINRDEQFAQVRPQLAAQCGAALAALHSTDVSDGPELPVRDAAVKVSELARMNADAPLRSPVFELALRWLQQNVRERAGPPRLVHGDFRNGNLIVGPDGLRAVLDWELAHLGDPLEDIGYLTINSWRFGITEKAVGGFGTLEQLLDAYVAAGQARPDHDAIRFWQILGSLRWGLVCLEMARPPEEGGTITVERAMIGRRASETELDLLDLLAPEGSA